MSRIVKRPLTVPWVHASVCKPFFAFFGSLGVAPEKYLERHRLPSHQWDWHRDVIPFRPFVRLVDSVACNEGIPNAGEAVISHARQNGVSWAISSGGGLTLYTALKDLTKRRIASVRLSLLEGEGSVWFCRTQASPASARSDLHAGWFAMAAVIELARSYIGVGWQPLSLTVPAELTGQRWLGDLFPETTFREATGSWMVEVSRDHLSCASESDVNRGAQAEFVRTGVPHGQDLAQILRSIVGTYLPSGVPKLPEMSEILGMTPRTMQRRLSEANSSYSSVLEGARLSLARRLLQETDERIVNIAYGAGYEAPGNFTRAFRNLTGTTPSRFRQLHR